MPLPPAGHTPDHVPLHTPGHVGGGAIAPTLGPGAAHGRGLVLTTGGEEVVPTLHTLAGGTTTAGLPSQTGRDTMEIG